MGVNDHRLIGNICGAGLVIDNAMQTIIQAMILPDREPDLPPDVLSDVGKHLLRVGDACLRRAAAIEPPAWPA